MGYTFARIGAVLQLRVEDYYIQGRRGWLRLREKGGKVNELPCHHALEKFLDEYLAAAGIAGLPKTHRAMRKPPKDYDREDRIENEVIVDAHGSEEKAMSWYCYLEGKMQFPFRAKCIAPKSTSPVKKGEAVDVQSMASEEDCSHDMLVLISWQGRKFAVPLSQLAAVDVAPFTAEAIADWHYWLSQGYLLLNLRLLRKINPSPLEIAKPLLKASEILLETQLLAESCGQLNSN